MNFSDTATVEDLTSPAGIERFNVFYAGYTSQPRLAGSFKALHIYQDGASFHAVDFAISALTLDDLAAACQSKLLGMNPDAAIPTQPRELWWEFWRRPVKKTFIRFPMRSFRKTTVFATVRGL